MQSLKKEAAEWASKYAKGGSARKLSARKFYIAVDALQVCIPGAGMAAWPACRDLPGMLWRG